MKIFFVDQVQYRERSRRAHAEIAAYRSEHGEKAFPAHYRQGGDPRNTPGMMYEEPWYFNPRYPNEELRQRMLALPESTFLPGAPNRPFLSYHYWHTWSHIRPPLCIMTPNSIPWEIDRVSSNGTGWQVATLPRLKWPTDAITCSPSIVVTGYHGWMGINGSEPGTFSQNLDDPTAPWGRWYDGTVVTLEQIERAQQ